MMAWKKFGIPGIESILGRRMTEEEKNYAYPIFRDEYNNYGGSTDFRFIVDKLKECLHDET